MHILEHKKMIRDFSGIDYLKTEGGIKTPSNDKENTMKSLSNNAEMFVPSEDVTEKDENGIHIQVAVKGVPIPMGEAKKLGLIKEEKSKEPAENKSAKPAENKTKGGDK